MENISINTTQNVGLNYSMAGVGKRMLAIMLDSVFRYSYLILLSIIGYNMIVRSGYGFENEMQDPFNQMLLCVFTLLALPGLLYHLVCETFLNGQSFGKKIVKIKVVKLDGTQPNFGSYLIRSMFRLIDNGIIGLICIAASQKTQRVGDMVAGTTVIELNKKLTLDDTILSKQKTGYQVVYQQVALLSDADANTIKEVLDFSLAQAKTEHVALLAKKIKSKYGIGATSQDDFSFLNTVLEDYSHYQFEK